MNDSDPIFTADRSATGLFAPLSRVKLPLTTLVLFGGGSALAFAFMKLASEVREGETNSFDDRILRLFRTPDGSTIGPGWVPEAVRDVTALGSFMLLGVFVVIVVGYCFAIRRRFEALFLAGSVIGGTILTNLLKIGFNRPRPDLANTPEVFTASFPSGHATMSAVVFLTLGAIMAASEPNRRLDAFYMGVAILLTLIVGVSRIFLGVHFPTDVIAGWCIGSAWAIFCALVARWLRLRTDRPSSSS